MRRRAEDKVRPGGRIGKDGPTELIVHAHAILEECNDRLWSKAGRERREGIDGMVRLETDDKRVDRSVWRFRAGI